MHHFPHYTLLKPCRNDEIGWE